MRQEAKMKSAWIQAYRLPSWIRVATYLSDETVERLPLLDRRGGAKRRGGCSSSVCCTSTTAHY